MAETAARLVMDARRVDTTIKRIAHQIVEGASEIDDLVLVSVGQSGLPLARRLDLALRTILDREIPLGVLDITLYRDDLTINSQPLIGETRLEFGIEEKTVILVDKVIFTGRTIRAALDALMEYGRPDFVRAAVLVDRGHRELPIRADFVGLWLDTVHDDAVRVTLDPMPSTNDRIEVIPGWARGQ